MALEVPPPGAGLTTVTGAVPATAMSAASIAAVNWVEDTNVVVRLCPIPLHYRTVDETAAIDGERERRTSDIGDAGFRLVVVGTGLLITLIVKVWALEVPPPGAGLTTVTWAVPAVAMSAAVIAAVN